MDVLVHSQLRPEDVFLDLHPMLHVLASVYGKRTVMEGILLTDIGSGGSDFCLHWEVSSECFY